MARQDARPLAKALRGRGALHPDAQWATFLRNHDELTLDKLTDAERQEVFAAFGPEPSMQVYGRGLKRRVPPMLDGDPRRIRMAYSLLFSLPGTPTLYYGEEIGMGEDLAAEGRMAVRSPMQWEPGRNGGFSDATPGRLVQRIVPDGYGPEHVNVRDQKRDPDSLWSFLQTLIRTYRECPELGWGEFAELRQPARSVLAHACTWEGSTVVAVHNLAAEPVAVDLTVPLPDDGALRPGRPAHAGVVRASTPQGRTSLAARRLRVPLVPAATARRAEVRPRSGGRGGQVLATRVSTSYVATGSPSALVTVASQRTSP